MVVITARHAAGPYSAVMEREELRTIEAPLKGALR